MKGIRRCFFFLSLAPIVWAQGKEAYPASDDGGESGLLAQGAAETYGEWAPDVGERYFGLWGPEERLFEFVVEEASPDGKFTGGVSSYRPGPEARRLSRYEPAAEFSLTLERIPGGTWRAAWTDAPTGGEVAETHWLRSPEGPFLGGRFPYERDGTRLWATFFLWPDAGAERNPFQPVEADAVEQADGFMADGDWLEWTAEDGLASNATRSIAQTPDGAIWVGTVSGLSRFNGQTWRTFGPNSDPPLPDANVPALLVDREGRLVIGTKSRGVFRYDGGAFVPVACNDELRGFWIGTLAEGPDGSIWFSYDDYLGRVTPEETFQVWHGDELFPVWPAYFPAHRNDVRSIVPLEDGRLLLAMNGNLVAFSPDDGAVTQSLAVTVDARPFRRIARASDGAAWWLNDGRWTLLDADLNALAGHEGMPLTNAIWVTRSGELWVAEPAPGFHLFRYANGRLEKFPGVAERLETRVVDMIEDFEGNIWLALGGGGVARFRPPMVRLYKNESVRVPGDTFHAVVADADGAIHYGSTSRFISGTPPEWSAWEVDDLSDGGLGVSGETLLRQVHTHSALAVGATGEETWHGLGLTSRARRLVAGGELPGPLPLLVRRRGDDFRFYYSDDAPLGVGYAHSVAYSARHGVFFGTSSGVFHLPNEEAGDLYDWNAAEGIPRFAAYCVFADSQDRVWIGGNGLGLYRIDGDELAHFSVAKDGLASDTVLSLWEDESGMMWVGGRSGLSRIAPDGRVREFLAGASFLKRPIHAITQDGDGNFWFGTSRGIFGVRAGEFDALAEGRIERLGAIWLGKAAGVPPDLVYRHQFPLACRTPDGALWFSMESGLLRFDPAAVLNRWVRGPATEILRCGTPEETFFAAGPRSPPNGSANGGLRLPPAARSALQFDYAGLSFIDPAATRFQYRLIGLSDEWRDQGRQRTVTFGRLAPGNYRFEVRAIAPNELRSPAPAVLAFKVAPFYHETWTFRLGLFASICAVAFGFYRWRLSYHKRIQELEQRVELDAERARIARDMHDDLGGALARIRLRCEWARELDTGGDEIKALTGEIGDFVRSTSKSLREIIWSLNSGKATYRDLADYLPGFVQDYLDGSRIRPMVEADESASQADLSPAFKRDLILVLKGIMGNTLRHSGASEFRLALRVAGDRLEISASDNGAGFDPGERAPDSHGLRAIEERVRARGGALDIVASPGKGACVKLAFPLSGNAK